MMHGKACHFVLPLKAPLPYRLVLDLSPAGFFQQIIFPKKIIYSGTIVKIFSH